MTAPLDNIYYGTCFWTDRTLIDSGFYPDQLGLPLVGWPTTQAAYP